MFFKLIVTIFLVIGIIRPEILWYLSEGWKFRDVEPSETYLILTRISLVFTLIVIWIFIPN